MTFTSTLPHRERLFLLSLAIVATALRIAFLLEVHNNPFFNTPTSDAYYYDAQAQSIARGDIVGTGVFFRAPGYPYFLGLIYSVFGHNYLAVRIIQHILGVISLVIIYLLARRLFNPAVAITASLLALLYPVLMYFEGQLLFDWFLTFICLIWALLFSIARDRGENWPWFLIGLLFGFICVTRPTFLPLTIPIFGYEIWQWVRTSGWPSALGRASLMAVGLAVAILPVTIRNYVVGKDPVLVASQGGINFFVGNNPDADGYSARMPGDIGASWEISEMTFYVEKQLGHHPLPSEESDFWYAKGVQFILQQPVDFLKLLVKKIYLFWNALEIPNNLDFYTFSQYSVLLRWMPVGFWLVGPLGLLGMALAWKAKKGRMMAAFVVMYCAIMVMFFVCDRYRLPVVPFMCIFAAYAVAVLWDGIKKRKVGLLATSAIPLAALALVVNTNAYHIEKEEPVHQSYMLGLIQLQHGEYDKAASQFAQASSYGKPMRNLYLHWGECESALGRDDAAKEKFRLELSYHPDSYGALADLAELFLGEGVLDSVVAYATQAIAVKPFMSPAYVSLGQAFYRLRDLARADSVLTVGSTKCGAAFRYGSCLLAGIHLERGKAALAESEYRSLLQPRVPAQESEYEASYLVSEEARSGIDERTLLARTYYGLGHVFVSRGQLDSALACFQRASSILPSYSDAWADLGVAYLQMGRLRESESALREALRLQSDNFMYWYNYASLLLSMSRFAEAQQALEKTLSLRPDFLPAQRDLASLAGAQKK